MLNLASMLVSMGVDGWFQDNPYFVRVILSHFFDFGFHLIYLFWFTFDCMAETGALENDLVLLCLVGIEYYGEVI